ncbi:hypothetical protein GCM10028810_02700 [Spirosoma litoris]
MDDPSTVALILAIPMANNSFWTLDANSRHFFELAKDSSFLRLRSGNLVARTTFDTARAQFFLHGVNPGNASAYQFRVMAYPSNQILVPWQTINRFTDSALIKSSALPRMAYLGGYKAPLGQSLIVDVRKTGARQLVGTSLVSWVSIKPVISNVYTSDNLDAFLKKLQYPWAKENNLDQTSRPATPLTLPSTNTNLILFLAANIYHKDQVQYELIRNGDIIIPWKNNEYDNSFIWLKEYEPGRYQLNIRYTVQPQHVTTYNFEVEPAWYQSQRFKLMIGMFLTVCLGALIFFVLYIQQKRKSREELATKTKLQLELKAIYAQLNPHFVFNALSSIQGLINKQDIQGANNYLADFARLMRESLANSNKEEVSLHEEIKGLETYLRLEQLRFGFTYQILLDDSINQYESSIPALLLQPLVENAVKHGVSALGENGVVTIRFDKNGDTMIVRIVDNGKGFLATTSTGGFGLKLTRDRIDLLNKLNRDQPIQVELPAHSTAGTEIILRFTHWFA